MEIRKIFIYMLCLFFITCSDKKEINPISNAFWNKNLNMPEFDLNEIFSIVETYGTGPPPCILDCSGISIVDPEDGNSFCPWIIDLQDKDCITDCSKNEKIMFSYFAFTCEESMKNDQRYHGMVDMVFNLMNSAFLNDDILRHISENPTFSQILVDLLPPDEKVVSLKYNNRNSAQENMCSIVIVNKTGEKLSLDWIKPNGQTVSHGFIETDFIKPLQSYKGHAFKTSSIKKNKILNYFIVPKTFGLVIIK